MIRKLTQKNRVGKRVSILFLLIGVISSIYTLFSKNLEYQHFRFLNGDIINLNQVRFKIPEGFAVTNSRDDKQHAILIKEDKDIVLILHKATLNFDVETLKNNNTYTTKTKNQCKIYIKESKGDDYPEGIAINENLDVAIISMKKAINQLHTYLCNETIKL